MVFDFVGGEDEVIDAVAEFGWEVQEAECFGGRHRLLWLGRGLVSVDELTEGGFGLCILEDVSRSEGEVWSLTVVTLRCCFGMA